MGFRMRKSIKVVPGVRLNVSKTGVGASVGGKCGRYSAHSSGRKTVSAGTGVPGVYYQESVSGGSSRRARPRPVAQTQETGSLRAEGREAALQGDQGAGRSGDQAGGRRAPGLPPRLVQPRRPDVLATTHRRRSGLLDAAFATGQDPADDEFVTKYLATRLELPIAKGSRPSSRSIATRSGSRSPSSARRTRPRRRDRRSRATRADDLRGGLARRALPRPAAGTRSIELTEGMKNEDDASALLCVFRGAAFREQGFHDAAHEAFKEALRSRSRAAPVRHLALAERAANFLAQGKKAQARKDLERILAEDSTTKASASSSPSSFRVKL